MAVKSNDRITPIVCAVLFGVFAFCWIHFFQGQLLCAMIHSVTGGDLDSFPAQKILITLPLTLLVLLTAIPSHRLLGFKGGLYACNYLLPSIVLGAITGFNGSRVFGQTLSQWITVIVIAALMVITCKILAPVPRVSYYRKQREACGNLFIITVLFCLTAVLGNTDENLHRELKIQQYSHLGQYRKALSVGASEQETNPAITLARLDAMLRLDAHVPGSGVGEYLFSYPINNTNELRNTLTELARNSDYDSSSVEIAQALISRNLSKADSLITPYIEKGVLPKYYLQLLVLTNNQQAATLYPEQYSAQKEILDSLNAQLEQLKSEPLRFQANSTYIKYHTTYFWYYNFSR